MRATLFLRIASVLTFIHAALHTVGGVFGGAASGAAQTVVDDDEGAPSFWRWERCEVTGILSAWDLVW